MYLCTLEIFLNTFFTKEELLRSILSKVNPEMQDPFILFVSTDFKI